MKTVLSLIAVAIILSSGVMFFLVKKGAALRPAGVIAPSEFAAKPEVIGQAVALRLFPDFQTVKNVIWHMDISEAPLSQIPETTLTHYQTQFKPTLIDLRNGSKFRCETNCWYVKPMNESLPEELLLKVKSEATIEIFIQSFTRSEAVSESCETEKTLDLKCIRPVSVREVKKKFKTDQPYFFMRRYLDSQFFLFIEKPLN